MKTLIVLMLAVAGISAAQADVGENPERALIAYMKVKPGTEQEFLKAAQTVIEESRGESGNIRYQLHESVTNPEQFVFYELYRSDADLKNHRNSPHVIEFLEATKPITVQFTLEEYSLEGTIQ